MKLMNIKKFIIYFLFIYSFLFTTNLYSEELEIGISQGSIKPTPIAITDFFSQEMKSKKIGKDIAKVISNNLERSVIEISFQYGVIHFI